MKLLLINGIFISSVNLHPKSKSMLSFKSIHDHFCILDTNNIETQI